MNLTVPSFVEKVDLHIAIELAPAQAYLQNRLTTQKQILQIPFNLKMVA